MALSKTYLFRIVSVCNTTLVLSLYSVQLRNGSVEQVPTESCLNCKEIRYLDIPNVPHRAGRLYLVNKNEDCKILGNTLIESTATSGVLYYDVSLVDGLTCYPISITDWEVYTLTQIDAEDFCGESMCKSLCTSERNPHECQVSTPYTHYFSDSLRSSPLGDSRVYTYAYDDDMGLLHTNKSFVRMNFRVTVKETNHSENFSKSPKAKSGTMSVFLSFSLLIILAY